MSLSRMCGARSASHSLSVLYSWDKQRMWSMPYFAGQEECIDPWIEIQVSGPFFKFTGNYSVS